MTPTPDAKPREWVLNLRDGFISETPGIIKFKGYAPAPGRDLCDVIEKSAYDRLAAELAEAKLIISGKTFFYEPSIEKERNQLRESLLDKEGELQLYRQKLESSYSSGAHQELKLLADKYRDKLSLLHGWLTALYENKDFTEADWPTVKQLRDKARAALEGE